MRCSTRPRRPNSSVRAMSHRSNSSTRQSRASRRSIPTLNAVIHERFERAHATKLPPPDGPFRGVPILVKDLDGPLAGEPYHLGNRLLKEIGSLADHDSYLIAKLKAAGFVVWARRTARVRTAPDDRAHGVRPHPQPVGPGAQPGRLERRFGRGVASGMVPIAHAGDGGARSASRRALRVVRPEAHTGGVARTRRRRTWGGLVVRHVVTARVRDSAAVLDVLAGPMPGDPYSAAPPARPFPDEVGADAGPLRIGVRTAAPGRARRVAPESARGEATRPRLLESLGHDVEPGVARRLRRPRRTRGASPSIQATSTAHDVDVSPHAPDVRSVPTTSRRLTWSLCDGGRTISSADYVASPARPLEAWSRRMARWWAPTAAASTCSSPRRSPSPRRARRDRQRRPRHVARALGRMFPSGSSPPPFNITGQPAISVPAWLAGSLADRRSTRRRHRTGRSVVPGGRPARTVRPWAGRTHRRLRTSG